MADKEAAPTTSDAIVVCTSPDMCRRGKSIVAYDIFALQSDDSEHSTDVRITGVWASHDRARLTTVYQDEPGDAGLRSGTVKGYARPIADLSPTVRINGATCVRHDTEYEMNCNGPDGPANTRGRMVYARGGPANVVEADGNCADDACPPIELSPEERTTLDAAEVDPQMDEPRRSGGHRRRRGLEQRRADAAARARGDAPPSKHFRLAGPDGYLNDLGRHGAEFGDALGQTLKQRWAENVALAKVAMQLGAFVWQDATGRELRTIFDPDDLARGEQALGSVVDAYQGALEGALSPLETARSGYATAVDWTSHVRERVAQGESAAMAGEWVGSALDPKEWIQRPLRAVKGGSPTMPMQSAGDGDRFPSGGGSGQDGGPGDGVTVHPRRGDTKEGSFFEVHREGDEAVKRLKDEVGDPAQRISLDHKRFATSETVDLSNQLRAHPELRDVIPAMRVDGADGIRMAWVEGTPLSQLRPSHPRWDQLHDQAAGFVSRAAEHLNLNPMDPVGLYGNGFSVLVDRNPANFLLTGSGDLRWIDPIAIFPPGMTPPVQ